MFFSDETTDCGLTSVLKTALGKSYAVLLCEIVGPNHVAVTNVSCLSFPFVWIVFFPPPAFITGDALWKCRKLQRVLEIELHGNYVDHFIYLASFLRCLFVNETVVFCSLYN